MNIINITCAHGSGGGELARKWLRRVSGEHASLSGNLPLAWNSSIFVAADPSRLDILRSAGPALLLCPSVAERQSHLTLLIVPKGNGQADGQVDGQANGQVDGQIDGQVEGQADCQSLHSHRGRCCPYLSQHELFVVCSQALTGCGWGGRGVQRGCH